MQQQPMLYDFLSALTRLQDRIQELSASKQQAAAPSSRLGATWAFLKANRGNVLLLLTFYSMSTASVVGSIMAEHRLQSDRLLEGKEQERLQQHITRWEQQVEQQQQLLDGLAADLQQQQHSGSNGGWRGAAAVRQRMLTRLQQWREEAQVAQSVPASSSAAGGSSKGSQQQQQQGQHQEEEFGVRVGPLGRGFLI